MAARKRQCAQSRRQLGRRTQATAGYGGGRTCDLGRRGATGACPVVCALDDRTGVMPAPIPSATYRLQLTPGFGFGDAASIVPYLKSLGITHVYASPFLKSRAGSQHGYDVIDYNSLNPELGGEEGFRVLREALDAADMGLLLDFVPNHMA